MNNSEYPVFNKIIFMNRIQIFISCIVMAAILACSNEKKSSDDSSDRQTISETTVLDPMSDIGVGPVKNIVLPDFKDEKLASKGKEIFESYCSACHKMDKRYVGPPLENILERRTPEWVLNMILNPEVMVRENALARQVLEEYHGAPMANQNLSEEQARAILEYLR